MKHMLPVALTAASLFAPTAALAQFGFLGAVDAEGNAKKAEVQVAEFIATKPAPLKPFFKALYLEGERNAVLNLNHLGLAAMETGQWDIAKKAFDQAIMRIDAIYASDENAKKAKSIWNEEKVKDWKGEPYERVMTYYYRGLLYLKDGEFDNAAASFRAADYQDTQAEREEFQGDFGLMPFMAAWAQNCRGNTTTAKDLYAQAVARDKSVASLSPDMKFLVLVDSGNAPEKYGAGQHKEILKIRAPKAGRDKSVKVIPLKDDEYAIAGTWAVGDVQMQAETRGGRPIDGILNGKAQWKENTGNAGQAATTVGLTAMQIGLASNNRDLGGVGAIVGLLGMFATMAAKAMTPAADTRGWGSLPNVIYAASVNPQAEKPAPIETKADESPPVEAADPVQKPKDAEAADGTDSAEAGGDDNKSAQTERAAPKAPELKVQAVKWLEPKIKIEYETSAGTQTREPVMMVAGGACGFAWARTRSALMPGDGGTALVSPAPVFEDAGREKQNGLFRSQLFQSF